MFDGLIEFLGILKVAFQDIHYFVKKRIVGIAEENGFSTVVLSGCKTKSFFG